MPSASDEVAQTVLGIVAEQTGYPPDMLALDLDLEADLGIDTVKQAEMFAAIRAAYGIERDENLALRDYPTLGRAIEFVYERRPDLRSAAPVAVPAAAPVAATMVPDATAPDATAPAVAYRERRRSTAVPPGSRLPPCRRPPMRWRRRCWGSWRSRRVIRRTCWSWTWTWKPTWASTR